MLELHEALIILGYLIGVGILLTLMVKYARRDKDLDLEFDGFYFLRLSVGGATLAQAGFVVLACALFWTRQNLAVGTTALIGLPGWFIMAATTQWGFFRRYNRLSSLIRRLEQLGPGERALFLESLPPEVFMKLPGDYRIVTWQEYTR